MSNSVGLVIFDCDGVLVDTERISVRIDAQVITELGWPISEAEVIERFVGRPTGYMVEQIEERLGRFPKDWEESFERLYQEAFEAELAPVDGVVEALDRIDAMALPTCVASSGGQERMRLTLGLTGLYSRFEGRIFSAEEVASGKPAPDIFLHAAGRMGVEPASCVVVEDSFHGIQAARSAGMRSFGYSGGVTPAHRIEGPRTVVFDDMRTLPALLRAM